MCRFGWNEIILCHYLLEFWFLALSLGFRLSFWNDIAAARAKRNIFRAYCPSYVLNRFLTKSSCFNDRWRKKSDRQFSNYFSGTSNSSSKKLVVAFFLVCYDYLNNQTADTELSKWKTIEREKKRWHSCKYKTRKTTENEQEKMSFNNAVTEDGQKTRRKNH